MTYLESNNDSVFARNCHHKKYIVKQKQCIYGLLSLKLLSYMNTNVLFIQAYLMFCHVTPYCRFINGKPEVKLKLSM